MAIKNTRQVKVIGPSKLTLAATRADEEEEEEKLSGLDRLHAAQEKAKKGEAQRSEVSGTYREVDKENGRIRTRPTNLTTPSWQDDPEELAKEASGKSRALNVTGLALSYANAAAQATGARAKAAQDEVGLFEQSFGKYQSIIDDPASSDADKFKAKRQIEALKPYYAQARQLALKESQRAAQAETAANAGKLQLERQKTSLQNTRERLARTLGMGDAKAKEFDKQAKDLQAKADNIAAAGKIDERVSLWSQANEASRRAESARGQYATYLAMTEGEEAANKYLAGEREKKEPTFGQKVLNTLGGSALNFLDQAATAPLILMSRIMEIPDDIAYAITKDERFRQDRNSDALLASDPATEYITAAKENAGGLGSKLVGLAGTAGSMWSLSAFGGAALGATGKVGQLVSNLNAIANSSPLATSAVTRYAARLGAGILGDVLSSPGNAAISTSAGVNAYSEALENGASWGDAAANGIMKGGAEYFSNKLFTGTPFENTPGEKGYVTQGIEYLAEKMGKSKLLEEFNAKTAGKVLTTLLDKGGEGMEEVVTAFLDPLIDYVTYNPNGSVEWKIDQLWDEFEGGVMLSILMSGGEAALKPGMETAQIRDQIMAMGYSKEIANTYAPQIKKYLKALDKMGNAIQDAAKESQTSGNVQTPETVLARIVQKVTRGEALTGQDARKILADPEAMQALMDGGYLGGKVNNDSEGRKEIVRAAEEYATDNATPATDNATPATDNNPQMAAENGPPVPNNLQQATQTAQETQGEQQGDITTPEESPRLRLKTAEKTLTPPVPERKLTLGNTNTEVQNNGQQEAKTARAEAGGVVPGGSGERGSGLRAGEQAGQLGRSPEGWRSLSREEKAAARRAYADDAGITAVSARSLGVKAATEDSTVRVYPREAWEPDLQRIASKVEKATGKPVTFVLGAMKVNAGGRQLTVRGVNTGSGIIVQADDPSITAEKIATHEAYHAFAAMDPELSARVLKQIRKQFPENRLRQIAETYLDKLYGIADLNAIDPAKAKKALAQVRDEICADAYAGINAFSANADEYTTPARQAVTEARRETAAATERRTGPPAESGEMDKRYGPDLQPADYEKAAKYAFNRAAPVQTRLNTMLDGMAARLGITHNDDPQKSVKSIVSRLKRNQQNGKKPGVWVLKDLARGHLELNSWDDIPKALELLRKNNIPYTTEVKNTEQGYRGLHVLWNDGGIGVELQLSTPEAWKIKMATEEIYSKWREADVDSLTPEERAEYNRDIEHSKELWRTVQLPDFSSLLSSVSETGVPLINRSSVGLNGGLTQEPSLSIKTREPGAASKSNLKMRSSSSSRTMDTIGESLPSSNILAQNGDNVNGTTDSEQYSAAEVSDTDEDYLAAVESGEDWKAERMVRDAALAWGAETNDRGKPLDLYHGTPRFGFTKFDMNKETDSQGMIYTSTKREVSANYAGRDHYAGTRPIGTKFIENATDVNDIIQNAKTVYQSDYHVMTEADKAKVREKIEADVEDLMNRYNEITDHRDLYKWDDEDATFTNALAWVEDLFYTVQGNKENFDSIEEYRKALEDDLERFERNLERVRDYLRDHYDELKGNKAYKFLTGFEMFDLYVDLAYSYSKVISGDELIQSTTGNIQKPPELQDAMDQIHNVGAYHLYGNPGNNPVTIDAKEHDWLSVQAPEIMGDEKYHSTDAIAKKARALGYTSITIKNVYDGGIMADDHIYFNANQVKSADPVTYDDNGNVIPLSERFNSADEDIRYSADEEYIPESAAEYGQLKRQGKFKAPKITRPVSKSTAAIAKNDLRKALLTAYSIPAGSRAEMGKMIDALADQYLKNKSISWNDRENLINKLWENGVMTMEADDGFQAVRDLVRNGRIYVPQSVKDDFGDDWNSFRREAMGEGIYLVNDENAAGWDQWNVELSDAFPGLFPEDEYDPRSFLERVVDLAKKGKGEKLSLAEYAAKTGGYEYATEEDMMDNLERQADYALRAFAEKANLEIYLKDRTGVKIAQERQRMGEMLDKAVARERERGDKRVQAAKKIGANALAKEKQREEDRRQKEREHRKEVAQRLRERQAMRELQQKTLKQLQWLSRNQNKFPAEAKKQVQDLLEDMDVLAVSAAEEMHIDNATGKTWKDLRDMYLEAKENDPNWMPSAQLEKIVMRLDAKKIGDLDMGALQDLYKAAIGMRTELYNRNNLINDELHRTMDEVYENAKAEIQNAKGGYKAGLAQRYAEMQLTPMNRFLKMAGWNPDSTWYGMAKGLEAGERAQRKFKTESQRQIAPVLEQYKEWMKTADGQGKNAKWYEIKVPESWEYHMGDKPIFSDKTVTVYMTPAQKVHMYLESKNLDNLRHMEGGRTFADKELYSKGKRAEAFANGTTVRLLPETVKSIVSDLTAEEQALANALEQYYNSFSKQEINRVSNILYGYDKAMGGYYAPIFTNDNYTKSDPGVFDLTAEGVGNLKERQHAANPSWNISAFDAFERSVDRTGKFVGLSIPIRNMNTLWNWRESGNSMKDVVSHKWNKPGVDFVGDLMTELQSGRDIKHPKIEQLTNAALSKYIGATFGSNPSIVLKQFASFPLAGTYLGYDNLIKGILRPAADTDLISKYTGELDYRLLGYATPETATLKNNPNKLQEKGPLNFIFGGGAITWMDGLTVRTLWNGAEQKVKSEQPDLEVGTKEQIDAGQSPFYQAVAKEFEESVSRSQPMYDTMHRADVMREGDPITRTFTLFKTVPMQELNMLAQTIGEANYYKSIGADKATQTAARQKAGRAFLGIMTGNLMIGVISFLNALLKNGAKAYKDKDGELNAKSIVTGMLKQYVKDAAGLAMGGSEAADILSAILFGDKWYGLETPGIEQISSIIEKTIKASTKTANMVKDSVDVLKNGGDWFQYMRDHGGDYVSSVEEIGRMLATYGTGLPVDNVKAYLLGAAQHISPAIKTAYEDVVSKADKSGLKGLTGASLEMRTSHIMQDRAGDVSERTVETIAGLYEAGYTDAAPPDVAKKYSVNGEDRTLNASEDQLFREVWRSSVGGALDDITGDKRFKTMSQADQAKVIKRLYDYGLQTAKAEVWDDYNPDKWVTTANDLAKAGIPLSEWLPIQQTISEIPAEKKNGKTVNGSKKEKVKNYIDSLPYSQDQKKALYSAAGYTDTDDVRWHTGSWGRDWNKTYAPADTSWLERTPQERTTGLKLPSTPQARQTTTRLQLPSAPQARPTQQNKLRLK